MMSSLFQWLRTRREMWRITRRCVALGASRDSARLVAELMQTPDGRAWLRQFASDISVGFGWRGGGNVSRAAGGPLRELVLDELRKVDVSS